MSHCGNTGQHLGKNSHVPNNMKSHEANRSDVNKVKFGSSCPASMRFAYLIAASQRNLESGSTFFYIHRTLPMSTSKIMPLLNSASPGFYILQSNAKGVL